MRLRSVGLLLIAGVSTQFGAAFATTLFDRTGPAGTVFLRLLLAALVLLLLFRPVLRGRTRAQLRSVALLGLALAVMNFGWYQALARQPIGPTVTLEFLGPLAVAVWGSRQPRDFVWILLAAAGVALLGGGGSLTPAGVAFTLLAACAWASYILLATRVGRDWDQATGLAAAMVVGALVVAPVGIADGGSELLAPGLLVAALAVALASSVVPYTLEMFALREIPQHVFGVLMSLEPAIGCLAGLVVLGQGLAATEVLAVGLVIAACAGATLGATRPQPAVPV